MAKKKGKYYAVAVGRIPGIYRTWADAEQQIKGFSNAKFEKFLTEAEARKFMNKYRGSDAIDTSTVNADAPRGEDTVGVLSQLLGSMDVRDTIQGDDTWVEKLRARHGNGIVAFCAGSSPLNGRDGCTAAYAVSFPLEHIHSRAVPVTDRPSNNHSDCLAARAATTIANELDPNRHRALVIYTRYEGLVLAMADHNGRCKRVIRWKRNGWKTSENKPVASQDIYEALLKADERRVIIWRFLDTKSDPSWLVQLHQEAHDAAESVARTATGA